MKISGLWMRAALLLSAVCSVARANADSHSEGRIQTESRPSALPHKRHVRPSTVQPRPILDATPAQELPSGPFPTDGDAFMIDTSIVGTGVGVWGSTSASAFDGTNWFTVWTDQRNGDMGIFGARVEQSGRVLDPAGGLAVSVAPDSQRKPAIAWGGSCYLITWEDRRLGNWDVYAARVTAAGELLDSAGIAVSPAGNGQIDPAPAVAFDGTNFLLVWSDDRSGTTDIYGARVNQAGALLDPNGIPISTAPDWQEYPSVSFGGSDYMVVWEDWRQSEESDIYGSRVTTSGNVLDTAGIPISTASDDQYTPVIAFDGTNYLVVWEDWRGVDPDIYGARVNQAGVVLDHGGIPISTAFDSQQSPSVGFDGTNFLAAWEDYRFGTISEVYAARINSSGTVLDPTGFPVEGDTSLYGISTNVASGPAGCLVTWTFTWPYSINSCVWGARVSSTGTVLDSSGIIVSSAANAQVQPAIGFDGNNYLVAYVSQGRSAYDIYGMRVSQSGVSLDSGPIRVTNRSGNWAGPSVAFDGTNYLVVWAGESCYAARVSPAGAVLDTAGIFVTGIASRPKVIFNGSSFLVVWAGGGSTGNGNGIFGKRISVAGVILDTVPINICVSDSPCEYPALASGGGSTLVVWEDWRASAYLYRARLNSSGELLDSVRQLTPADGNWQFWPGLAFDGVNFLAVWEQGHFDISGARVTPGGAVLDSVGFLVAAADSSLFKPTVDFVQSFYLVVCNRRHGINWVDVFCSRVSPDGALLDTFQVATPALSDFQAVHAGAGSSALFAWSGRIGSYRPNSPGSWRIWGRLYPFGGVAESPGHVALRGWSVEVSPNPARDFILVRSPDLIQRIRICDIAGRVIEKEERRCTSLRVVLKGIRPGVYFLRAETDGQTCTRKFIVE